MACDLAISKRKARSYRNIFGGYKDFKICREEKQNAKIGIYDYIVAFCGDLG